MFLPYATDAPVYHFPKATIGIILVNVLVFLATVTALMNGGDDGGEAQASVERFMLQSDRIAPWQWVTTNFLHGDIMHLIGNMLFLWAFGLIVEGKIGWRRFLTLYLLIGVLYGAIIQIGMVLLCNEYHVVLGASGVIFGLIGCAVMWAPRNEISVFVWLFLPRGFDIPIMYFGFFYLAMQVLFLSLTRFELSSDLLHFVGFFVGTPLALLMLKRNLVDCEGWDLLSVLAGNEGTPTVTKEEVLRDGREAEAERRARQRQLAATSLRDAVAAGQTDVALSLFMRHQTVYSAESPWPSGLLGLLTKLLHTEKRWADSVPVMTALLEQSDTPQVAVRLKLAQILLQVMHNPRRCLKLLATLPDALTPDQQQMADRLQLAAEAAEDRGDGELLLLDD